MILQAGARLGPYEIVSPLGAGGMGEVYKARDTRLDRTVAIKVLPASLAADPVFRDRFDREARTISSLDHSNICILYDVGREAGVDYLVMQFLDGETLADRLARGPLPVAQAVEYAGQMAMALDRAHRAGIVHRDLKPGNVMLTRSGPGSSLAVKLLDFGLAKSPMVEPARAADVTAATPLTGQGTIIGTLQYMAPEQLEGRDVDARTDLFALGSILYEMLTGKRAFEAVSQAGVMAAILEKEPPPVSVVQPLTPPGLDRIVDRCLAKDPDARWQSAADLAAALSLMRTDSGVVAAPAAPARTRRNWVAWVAGAAVLLTGALLAVTGVMNRRGAAPRLIYATLPASPIPTAVPEISPDGTMLVWSGSNMDSGRHPLWLQPLDSETGRAIPGTEGATFAFWSPDSRNLAFFADQKLKRVAVSGGAPVTICETSESEARGGSWGKDNVIIFSGARIGGLSRVPASGGTPQPLTTLDKALGHTTHRWPYFLPDGRHFLYFASSNGGPAQQLHEDVMFASVEGGEPHRVMQATTNVAFAEGRLLFVIQNRLMSQPFEPASGSLSGQPVPVLDDVPVGYGVTRGLFAAVGPMLVAAPNDSAKQGLGLQWVARDGTRTPAFGGAVVFDPPWIAPDGSRVVTTLVDPRTHRPDIWTLDLASGARARVTFEGDRWSPVWSRDGATVFYMLEQTHEIMLASKPLGGGAERIYARALPELSELQDCSDEYCVFSAWRPQTGTNYDLLAVRLSDGKVIPAAAGEADENDGRVSPDGTLLAYAVNQGGQENVYVRTFPSGSGLWQVTTEVGHQPVWSRDGHELYYLTDHDVVAVPVSFSTAGGVVVGPPRTLASQPASGPDRDLTIQQAQVAPDGRVLIAVARGVSGAPTPYRLVLNWNR